MVESTAHIVPSKCVTAHVSAREYNNLVESRVCGDGQPCLRDECEHCAPLNTLIDQLGDECEKRGCTMRECIFD